jgi:hypothetical protein
MNRALGISVVIACLHDEQPLARLLARLRASEGPSTPPLQIIVVDAAASAHCRSLCQQHQALWSPAEPCRGEQLRQGAALAEHEILWFLHADAELDDQAPAALRQVMADGAAGGYFAFRFSEARCWQSWLLERLVAWRNRVGTPYGDQGLFARRSLYFAAGQHAPWPLFEEVPLVKGLRKQGDFCRLAQGLRVSPRRWKRDGWWRRSCRNRLLAIGFMLGISPATLARLYSGRSAR